MDYTYFKFAITNHKIDINHDDHFYIELLADRGEISLLQLVNKYNGNLHYEAGYVVHILGLC